MALQCPLYCLGLERRSVGVSSTNMCIPVREPVERLLWGASSYFELMLSEIVLFFFIILYLIFTGCLQYLQYEESRSLSVPCPVKQPNPRKRPLAAKVPLYCSYSRDSSTPYTDFSHCGFKFICTPLAAMKSTTSSAKDAPAVLAAEQN